MSSIVTGSLVAVGVLVLALLVFSRHSRAALFGQINKLSRLVWGYDPVAVYQAQVDASADEIRDATKGLEEYQGLVARLQRQVEGGQKERNLLEAKIKGHLAAGQEDRAADLAMQLGRVEKELTENEAQLEQYRNAYAANLKKIRYAHSKIEEAKQRAGKLKADLRLSKAEAETAKLAQSFNVKSNTLDGLGEIEEEINRQIDRNRGKAQVITDLSQDGLADMEAEEALRKAEAASVLDRYRTKR
jgi:phage shock protein A